MIVTYEKKLMFIISKHETLFIKLTFQRLGKYVISGLVRNKQHASSKNAACKEFSHLPFRCVDDNSWDTRVEAQAWLENMVLQLYRVFMIA